MQDSDRPSRRDRLVATANRVRNHPLLVALVGVALLSSAVVGLHPGLVGLDQGQSDGGSSDGSGGAATTTTPSGPQPRFDFDAEVVDRCGQFTCRVVEASLANTGSAPAEDVHVTVNLYTTTFGNQERIWQGEQHVGDLPVNETYTNRTKVDVGAGDGAKVKMNDGKVVLQTIVEYDDGRAVSFARRIDVDDR